MPRELASPGADACRVIETLIDNRPCPAPADTRDGSRALGWHVDLGLDESGNRVCEILAVDYDGNGCPDPLMECTGEDFSSSLQGWFYQSDHPACENGKVLFTHDDVSGDLSRVRFECQTALCPQRRQCGAAAGLAEACDPTDLDSCGQDRVCVWHNSVEVCDWGSTGPVEEEAPLNPSCGRCAPMVGTKCPLLVATTPEVVWQAPVVEAGGCCAVGFHCESRACIPDRNRCE